MNNNMIKIENTKDEISKLFSELNELYKEDDYRAKQYEKGLITYDEKIRLYWQRFADKIDIVNKINAKRWYIANFTSVGIDLTNDQISLSINANKSFCFLSDCDQIMLKTYSNLMKYFMSKCDKYEDRSVRYTNETLSMFCTNNHDYRKHIEQVVNDYAKCKYVAKKAFLNKEQLEDLWDLAIKSKEQLNDSFNK